jgi:two-component system sensor histidine kinase FlrB
MERQIQDILLFARGGEAGDSVLTVTDALRKFTAAAESTLTEHATRIALHDRSRGAARMVGREDALQGLFNNLLENAIQHHAERIEITLRVGNEIEIDFADDGDGVPESLQGRIFDPFFTTRSGGTGLGLAVVQNLVLSHGGEIHLQQGHRRGACFRIRFPLALEAAETPSCAGLADDEQEKARRSQS